VALTPQDVARLAALARLELAEPECAELAPELDVILNSVARVGEVAGDDVPLMTHALPMTNVMRPDQVRDSLPQEAVLAILSAGAYGSTMASNYNSRPRPAEVLIDGKHVHLIRERETMADLLRHEKRLP